MSYGDGYDFHKVNRGTVPSFSLVLPSFYVIE